MSITAINHQGVKKAETTAYNAHDSGPNFESIRQYFIRYLELVRDAIINSVN